LRAAARFASPAVRWWPAAVATAVPSQYQWLSQAGALNGTESLGVSPSQGHGHRSTKVQSCATVSP